MKNISQEQLYYNKNYETLETTESGSKDLLDFLL